MKSSPIDTLLALSVEDRRRVIAGLNDAERVALAQHIEYHNANPWIKYQGDPVAFVNDGLGETTWSKQEEILRSVRDNKRTVVPACHAPGKTHIAARVIAYWASCYPPGTTRIVTTASIFRQVKTLMWPHIHSLQATHKLPGYTTQVEWYIPVNGRAAIVAEGIKPPDNNEASVQGIHAPNMLIVVDEAGGIASSFGNNLESLMTGRNTRMLVLGNPPTDKENTWFERICNSDRYNVIPIGAYDTPNFTGEFSGNCKVCIDAVERPHEIAEHLVAPDWVQGIVEEFGEDSPYYEARVLAKFPRDNTAKVLPMGWLEQAAEPKDAEPGRIKLGCDIAAQGGDEFVIAKLDGWKATMTHHSQGADNENAVVVAGRILEHIRSAEKQHHERGITEPVRVKIDSIGVGWGVVGILETWGRERKHGAEIVGVNVAESPKDKTKFSNSRAELWWTTRQMIQPDSESGEQLLDLSELGTRELAQLNAPTYSTDSAGRIMVEKKDSIKRRGLKSPDRAEAILLAIFEPKGSTASIVAPIVIGQTNPWAALG